MSLAQFLESRFRGDIRFRGQAYIQAERVSIARFAPEDLHGVVRDGVEYNTHLSIQENELRMFCSCVGDAQAKEPACKHLWVTILSVDTGDYMTGVPRAGSIPPFAADTTYTPSHLLEEIEDDFDGIGYE